MRSLPNPRAIDKPIQQINTHGLLHLHPESELYLGLVHHDDAQGAVQATPGGQILLTDPDAYAMATNGKGTRIIGYNVQTAVDVKHQTISSAVA